MFARQKRQLQPAGNTQFLENIAQVALDGLVAYRQFERYLLVTLASLDFRDDFYLPRRQLRSVLWIVFKSSPASKQFVVHPIPAFTDCSDALQEYFWWRRLEHNPAGTEPQCMRHLERMNGGGEDDCVYERSEMRQLPQRFHSWNSRHCQIEQKDVRLKLLS